MMHKIAFLVMTLHNTFLASPHIASRQPENTYSVQKYISNNRISPYILFTVTNNCCRCIMIYHNILNSYHGDTDISKFYMYENYECVLIDQCEPIRGNLTHSRKYKDYSIFFNSLNKQILYKNKHFLKKFELYQKSIIESIFLSHLNK